MTIQILDGGMGRELKRIGAPFQQPEWSALALMDTPETVAQAHQNFIGAGADIITTNTYALVPFHIGQDRFDTCAYDLTSLAIKQAQQAVEGTDTKIAGCIPPAFGSYQPESFQIDKFETILTPLIEAQKDHVDHWLIETMPSIAEGIATVNLIKSLSKKPIWISFTLNNRTDMAEEPTLRSGEPIQTIDPILRHVHAVLFNCSQPEEMEDAIKITRSLSPDIQIGAYANNFSEVKRTHKANEDISGERDDITPELYLDFAKTWGDTGATIIGGCCGITPEHIQKLSDYFKN